MTAIRQLALSAVLGGAVAAGLGGCMVERPAEVPADALIVSEGTGKLAYRAPEDGTVYVFDQNSDRLLYSGLVMKNQLVEVDPQADVIKIDGRTVAEKTVRPPNHNRIFFLRTPTTQPTAGRMQ